MFTLEQRKTTNDLFDTSSFLGISIKVSGLSRHLPTTCPESLQMRKHVFVNR
jgi:hypothetical protein